MYERYSKIRDERGFKDADVARATGIGKSTLSDWKNGKSIPKEDKLIAISQFLKCSLDYLMIGKPQIPDNFSDDEHELLELYSKLNKEQKTNIINMLKSIAPND